MSAAEAVPPVLAVFARLFSKGWLERWQQQRRAAPPPAAAPEEKTAGAKRGFYERIFSLQVTLWYLIFQRLNFDRTLSAVTKDLRAGGADRLGPRGRKLSRRARSAKTAAYNQARQRLPLELLQAALAHGATTLLALVGVDPAPRYAPGPAWRTRQLLDGSTLGILKTPALAKAFPPARNQRGATHWCLMRIMVGFCAKSGAVLSACCGSVYQSEQAMAWGLMERAAAFTVWIGDRNFGVWSVVVQADRFHQDVLVRLSKRRAEKLTDGKPLVSGEDRPVTWKPTRHDQNAPGTKRIAVPGRLIYVRLKKQDCEIDLWLFTTLPVEDYPVELLVRWYGQRWQAELHFRSVKTQMQMAELDVCSPEMARKEFYAGLLAYNLVRTVMWAAGERLEEKLQVLSFSDARREVLSRLKDWGRRCASGSGTTQRWVRLLIAEVARQTLPKRRKQRPSEIRRVRHRRQKFPPLTGSRAAARARDFATKSL